MQRVICLTKDIAAADIKDLLSGTLNYVLYKPKNTKLLGEKCYLVANERWQRYFVDKGTMALTLDDLKDLDFKKVVKIMFDGKEIENGINR